MSRAPDTGRPMQSTWPRHEEDEIAVVNSVLRSGRVNAFIHGDQCRKFEEEFAKFIGVPHAIGVANGTLALELALRALDIGSGDEVIVPARSFFASVSCVEAVGAKPVFADIESNSGNIDPASVMALITNATKAVIAVHLAGWPCDMDRLEALCKRHQVFLIEDCAQAHGAEYRSRRVGGFGDAAAFSFCTDKIISTGGEGGMLLLNNKQHWETAWAYKDHGKNPSKAMNPVPMSEYRYIHDSLGSNFRLTEMQAAIGRVQLAKLPVWLEKRKANAAILNALLGNQSMIAVPDVPDYARHAYYKYYFTLRDGKFGNEIHRAEVLDLLRAANVPASVGSCPDMSLELAFRNRTMRRHGNLPVAQDVGARTIMLPVDHTLNQDDMKMMASVILDALSKCTESREVATA